MNHLKFPPGNPFFRATIIVSLKHMKSLYTPPSQEENQGPNELCRMKARRGIKIKPDECDKINNIKRWKKNRKYQLVGMLLLQDVPFVILYGYQAELVLHLSQPVEHLHLLLPKEPGVR